MSKSLTTEWFVRLNKRSSSIKIYDEFVENSKSYHTCFVNKKKKPFLKSSASVAKANSKNCAGAKVKIQRTSLGDQHGSLNKLATQSQKNQPSCGQNVKKL